MTLEERLRNLCEQGKRTQAESLAKATLTNEPVHEVVIDESHVHVETPCFRGVHQLQTDSRGGLDAHSPGEYIYKSETIGLEVSTATMPEQAFDRLKEALAVQAEADLQAGDDDQPHPEDSATADPDATATTADSSATSPIGFLNGLL